MKYLKSFVLLAFLLWGTGMYILLPAQYRTLSASISGLPDQEVYLAMYSRDQVLVKDSMQSMNGELHFLLEEDTPSGTCWLFFGAKGPDSYSGRQPGYIEFIYDQIDLELYATYPGLNSSAEFVNSEENSQYRVFRSREETYQERMTMLAGVIDNYKEENDFYRQTIEQFKKVQLDRDSFLLACVKGFPGTYFASLAEAARQPLIPGRANNEERIAYLKKHYFDLAPINNPALLRSPVYNRKIIEYLSLYRVKTGKADQELAFRDAVDMIMANTAPDEELRSFVVEYLLKGFDSFGMEEIQSYIADNYVDENCQTDLVELALKRIEGYRKMATGQEAPDFVIRDDRHRTVRLSDSKEKYTAVVFWASYCEHCRKLMPRLAEWYRENQDTGLDIIAISLDTVAADWEAYLESNDLPWTNALEPLGWNGKLATDYNVYATPTIFILDNKRKIIAKPYTYRDFVREVKKLN